MINTKLIKIKCRGTEIIIKDIKDDFNHYIIECNENLMIVFGTKCINKNEVLNRAIKKTRNYPSLFYCCIRKISAHINMCICIKHISCPRK